MKDKTLNYKVLLVLAPVLILIGVAGFIVPPEKALTSGAAAYNVFHIIFGAIGLIAVFLRNEHYIRLFNIGFGLIDLYQVFASFAYIFPERYFHWTRVDDVLHMVIGAGLVLVGFYGFSNQRKSSFSQSK